MKKGAAVFGISFLTGDQLDVIFIEKSGGEHAVLGAEQISVEKPPSAQELSGFQNRLGRYRKHSPVWIDVMLRQAAFVKTFTFPEMNAEALKAAVIKGIQAEIPFLAEELSYHYSSDGKNPDGTIHVTMCGISKTALQEHAARLESFGITPQRILLSTEILFWLYQSYLIPQKRELGTLLLIQLFGEHAELLFVENNRLLQSRWVAQEQSSREALREAVEAAANAFQREFKRRPAKALVFDVNVQTGSFFPAQFSLPVEVVSPWPKLTASPIVAAAVEASASNKVFDFTLPETSAKRKKETVQSGWERLTASIFLLTFSVFALVLTRVLVMGGESVWIGLRSAQLSRSVKEVKSMREQAVLLHEFQERKSFPLILLSGIRDAIPAGILIQELNYEYSKKNFLLRGAAISQPLVDQFNAALGRAAHFEAVTLERVQSQQDERGETGFRFEIKGRLGEAAET